MNTTLAYTLALLLAAWITYRFGSAAIGVLTPGSTAATKAKLKKLLTKITIFGTGALLTIGLLTEYIGPGVINFFHATGNWITQGAHDAADTTGDTAETVTDNAPTIGLWTLIIAYSAAAMWWIFRTPDKQQQRLRTLLTIGLLIAVMASIKGLTYSP